MNSKTFIMTKRNSRFVFSLFLFFAASSPLIPPSPTQLALVKKDPIKKKEKDEPQPVTLFSEMKENWMIDIGTWTARTVSVTDRS